MAALHRDHLGRDWRDGAPVQHADRALAERRIDCENTHLERQAATASTPCTSGTKWRSRFWMPCLRVAVEDGHPEQAPRMLR